MNAGEEEKPEHATIIKMRQENAFCSSDNFLFADERYKESFKVRVDGKFFIFPFLFSELKARSGTIGIFQQKKQPEEKFDDEKFC